VLLLRNLGGMRGECGGHGKPGYSRVWRADG